MNELDIFSAALDLTKPVDREQFLDEACRECPELRKRIDVLLRNAACSSQFLESAAPGFVATLDQPTERLGTQIGRYKLLEQVGEGGMGIVFVAEQTEPVRRRVALKIIKPGMDTKQVIARFEAERQALAMMDHPNIARVLDAGTTEAGRPYFVMELVRGMPITDYCDKARLSPRQRLELFVDVCQAVQHAHQKGIIHRDLKPSNILITLHDGTPVVKVIDFGVAKAVGQQLTERTIYTALTQLVGTPLYMSPEQAEMSGLDVDTRSDVYSLGVLLYELLTGQTPFDKDTLSKAGLDELRRIIREDEPLRPSRRFSTVNVQAVSTASQHRGVDERRLCKILCGELDWIVMKALEKDRARRYESASALATDIQRYLSDEPVLACPPTIMYRLQKFARKHKPAFVTAAAIALCLVLGTTVSAWQAVRATTAEAKANANEQKAAANERKAVSNAAAAQEKEQEAITQRDEVKALADKLTAKEKQLQRTLYAAQMNLAKHAWDAGGVVRVRDLLQQHRPEPGETDLCGFEWNYLYRMTRGELLTIKARSRFVHSVAYSPDGKRVASAGEGTVTIWNAETGQEIFSLKGGNSASADFRKCVAFSPDGTRLATSGEEIGGRELKLWNAQTGELLLTLPGPSLSIAFSPDGKRLASAGYGQRQPDGTRSGSAIKIRDAQTGNELLTLKGATGGVAFSPDGKRVFSGNKVWDAQSGEELMELKNQDSQVSCVAYSPDGTRLASVYYNSKTLKMWNASSGVELLTLHGCAGSSIVFSHDSKRLAVDWTDGSVKVFDATTGQELLSYVGHEIVRDLAFSPDGKRLLSGGGGTLKIWDAQRDQKPLKIKGSDGYDIVSLAFSPDGKRLASGSLRRRASEKPGNEGEGKLWDALTGQEIYSLKGHSKAVNAIAFSPDGRRLASVSLGDRQGAPGEVKLWDAQSGQELRNLSFKGLVAGNDEGSIAFSLDGKRIAACGGERGIRGPGEVMVWDAETGLETRSFQSDTYIFGVAFSLDGKCLAAQSRTKLSVWDLGTSQEVHSLAHERRSAAVAFSPDGKRLVSATRVWDAQTGKELFTLKGHNSTVTAVAFSPDGRRLATASGDRVTKIWDTETGAELFALPGGGGLAFSPDGHRLAIGGSDGNITIYDATPQPEKP